MDKVSHLQHQSNRRTTGSSPAHAARLLQRKCACGQHTVAGGECGYCRRKRPNPQRAAVNSSPASEVPPIVHGVLRSPARPLDPDARASMESRFGHDFGKVRVHDDARAVESAQAVDALAYTVGRDIVFATGQYAPQTTKGRRLLAHELTHVVQQTPNSPAAETSTTSLHVSGGPASGPETEADRAATEVANEQPLTTSIGHQGLSLQRQEVTEEERRRWMGTQPMYQLRLDPQIEAQMMAFRMPELLDPEFIKAALSRMDLDTIMNYQPPPWLSAPTVPEAKPLVPRGAGPGAPRPASAGDVLGAVMDIPAVKSGLGQLKKETKERFSREQRRFSEDWQKSSTGGKIGQAAVLTYSAAVGAGVLGGALAGVLSDPAARQFTLDKLQGKTLPVPYVPGLNFQANLAGPDKNVTLILDMGAFLPSSWGFHEK